MEIQFDKNKNLQSDLIFTCTEFKKLFGYNEERKKKVDNLFIVANRLKEIGCKAMFVFGSFTTSTDYPNDIDVCFDISDIAIKVLEKNSSLFNKYEHRRFHKYLQVHLPFFKINSDDKALKQFMKRDRNGNERGIIEVSLKDLPIYDKE
jgi:histidinol phosphatase-like PHP family hydrolase